MVALATTPLVTAGELDSHLQRHIAPDVAELAILGASGAVRAYCGWDLARSEVTFEVEGDGGRRLTLPTLELVSVEEIRIDGVVDDGAAYPWLKYRKGQLYRTSGWADKAVIEVDCTHGYDPVPDLIKLVVLDVATRSVTNPENLSAATTGPVSRIWGTSNRPGATDDSALSGLHMTLLDQYRL